MYAYPVLWLLTLHVAAAVSSTATATVQDGSSQLRLSTEPRRYPYGFWESPITPEWMVGQGNHVEDIFVDTMTRNPYYVETRSNESGRNVIKDLGTHQLVFDGLFWDARTRVQEYGGGQTVAYNGTVYFSNRGDGRVYEIKEGNSPRPVTPDNPHWRWADFTVHPVHPHFIVGVLEDHSFEDRCPTRPQDCVRNKIALIDTKTGVAVNVAGLMREGPEGPPYDFEDSPRFSPDGKHLAVRVWRHPYMSWEASELWNGDVEVIDLDGDITLVINGVKRIEGGTRDVAVGEPNWVNSNLLLFLSDRDGYLNPWVYNVRLDRAQPLASTPIAEDFAETAFWLGRSNAALLDEDHALYASFRDGRSQFYIFKVTDGTYQEIHTPFAYVSRLCSVAPGKVIFLGKTDTDAITIVEMSVNPRDIFGTLSFRSIDSEDIKASPVVSKSYISLPTSFALEHPTTGELIHAAYYPPTNPEYVGGLEGELPPVVVNVHGGPTHFQSQGLSWETQLFTSRGFAWLNVNYGGSTTYGRAYRERLLGKWGIIDVEDPIIVVQQLGQRGLLDASRATIRGGSAGGFTTFAALAFQPDAFAAGMSMFGISDLRSMQAVLHKFESRYLLKYVGGTPQTDPELWWERSPISKVAHIKSPVLILQGADDPVVFVDQAVTMLEGIKANGGRAELRIFEGEGHGWRKADTIREALEREVAWYQNVFNSSLY